MKFVIITLVFGALVADSCVRAVAYVAAPSLLPYAYSAHSSSLTTPTQQQYHTQDHLGQYAYGYAEPHSVKHEVRSLDGVTRGSYSYRDALGKLQTVDYRADDNGFRVAATNLPSAPISEQPQPHQSFREQGTTIGSVSFTPDATATGDIHLATHREALLRLAAGSIASGEPDTTGSVTGSIQLPQPVDDTIAVAAAKTTHLKQYEQDTKPLHTIVQQGRVLTPTIIPTALSTAITPHIYNYGYPWRYYYY
uniref:Cuticle protein 6 n=1 Tax=Ceratitis capitata TaxID=7213 RepID=W8BYL0_CERCA